MQKGGLFAKILYQIDQVFHVCPARLCLYHMHVDVRESPFGSRVLLSEKNVVEKLDLEKYQSFKTGKNTSRILIPVKRVVRPSYNSNWRVVV